MLLSTDNVVDKVEIFDWYFPKFNADEEIKNHNPKNRISLLKIFWFLFIFLTYFILEKTWKKELLQKINLI